MEPNRQQPWQEQGRPNAWQGANDRRPQRPLGTEENGGSVPRFTGRQPAGGYPPPGQQPWQAPGPQAPQPGSQPRWTSPAPADPFDEPGEAPELRMDRSENLYSREDRFWDHVESAREESHTPRVTSSPKAEGHTLRWLVLIVAVIAAVGYVIYGAVFRVRSVTVEGIRAISQEEVIRLSGISMGMNIFSINDEQVEAGIESNRYLSFVCVDKQLPDKVIVQVRERTPATLVTYCGIAYTLDNRGMVLEESQNTGVKPDHLVTVSGLNIRRCMVGETVQLHSDRQMGVYTELLVELKVMSALDEVSELDLSDMDNLFLVSRDGYTVRLGNTDSLHAKLRAMILTRDHLNATGHIGGTIDVSTPINPTYTPEG